MELEIVSRGSSEEEHRRHCSGRRERHKKKRSAPGVCRTCSGNNRVCGFGRNVPPPRSKIVRLNRAKAHQRRSRIQNRTPPAPLATTFRRSNCLTSDAIFFEERRSSL